MKNKHL